MSCQPGLVMNGTRCIGQYSVGYNYHIDTPYSSFMSNSKSEQFTDDIATAAGCDKENVFISDIRDGSTIVTGMILSNTQTQATTITTQLNSYTGTIAGATVITSSAVVIDNTINNNNGNNTLNPDTNNPNNPVPGNANLGLIIGVAVGGTALVIAVAVIAFCFYKKYYRIAPEGTLAQTQINVKEEQHSL